MKHSFVDEMRRINGDGTSSGLPFEGVVGICFSSIFIKERLILLSVFCTHYCEYWKVNLFNYKSVSISVYVVNIIILLLHR